MSKAQLKSWLLKDVSRQDKVLILLGAISSPATVAELRTVAGEHGLRITDSWNESQILSRSHPFAIATPEGWELTDEGGRRLQSLGLTQSHPAVEEVAADLRAYLRAVTEPQTRAFVAEAIGCFEHGFYRSAVVLSWLGAVHVLQNYIVANHLQAFNAEAKRVDQKWKPAHSSDDIGRMKESEFLDRLAAISVIGKNVKSQLRAALDLRNACGHPNSLEISRNAAAHHLELLLLNVFKRF